MANLASVQGTRYRQISSYWRSVQGNGERESWANKIVMTLQFLLCKMPLLESGAYISVWVEGLQAQEVCYLVDNHSQTNSSSPSKQWLRSRLLVVEHGMFGLPVQTSWHVQILKAEDLVIFVTISQATIPQMVKAHKNYTSFVIYNKSCKWCC